MTLVDSAVSGSIARLNGTVWLTAAMPTIDRQIERWRRGDGGVECVVMMKQRDGGAEMVRWSQVREVERLGFRWS